MLLLGTYVLLSLAMDPGGFLGTDTGGKVATLRVMSERGDFDPDLGYWADEWDPEARVHGLFFTTRYGERYVNVTSLPMVLVARPLWDVGGYRATLLLPMGGAIATAFAGRALAFRLKRDTDLAWRAFWVVGLATPVAIYALDLWEHSIGLALMAWGVLALLDNLWRTPSWWRGLAAGAAFGAAAALRTEAFVYALTTTAIVCVVLWLRRGRLRDAVLTGSTALAGFAAVFAGNLLLEWVVIDDQMRATRASGAASAGFEELVLRGREGLVTFLALAPELTTEAWVTGAVLLAGLAAGAVSSTDPARKRISQLAAALVLLLYLQRALGGPGFVPGLVAATPLAGVAIGLAWRDPRLKLVALTALVPLPVAWAFQFRGGAVPQWAGRYVLCSGLLLAVVGLVAAERMPRWARSGIIGLSALVTVAGMAWLAQRSREVAEAAALLQARPEPVLISPDGFVPREFGATYGDARWLAAGTEGDLEFAFEVAAESGADAVALVALHQHDDPLAFEGWDATETSEVPFIAGTELEVTTYRRLP